MEDISNIPKMKVADLKKQLKSRGLSVTGNKTELVERLQKALQEGGDDGMNSSGVPEDDEFDEEEILGEDVDVDDDESTKITPQEEAEVLSGNIRIKDDSLLMQSEKKKITLKRSEPSLKSSLSSEDASLPKEDGTIPTTPVADQTEDSGANKENSQENDLTPKRKLIKLSNDTPEESQKTPPKKDAKLSEEERKLARMARFGPIDNRPSKLSMETGGTDLEKLKKRAERFGEITSKSLSKLDSLEKMKARGERFGSTATEATKTEIGTENQTDDAKAARAARFGMDSTKTSTGSLTEEEQKKKRAERFAAK